MTMQAFTKMLGAGLLLAATAVTSVTARDYPVEPGGLQDALDAVSSERRE